MAVGSWQLAVGSWQLARLLKFLKKVMASDFRDLKVYQKAYALAMEVFEITKSFPKEETYALTDQVRRSSRSV